MRHRKKGRKIGRDFQHRGLMLKSLFTSLLDHKKIKTTEARAKELVRLADSLIEKAKKNNLNSRRELSSYITDKKVYRKFFNEVLPSLTKRTGGNVRMVRIGYRKGDGAMLSQVELIEKKKEVKK